MGLYVPFAPSLLGAVFFFFLSFNFLFSIYYALLSCLNINLICPRKSLKKKKNCATEYSTAHLSIFNTALHILWTECVGSCK